MALDTLITAPNSKRPVASVTVLGSGCKLARVNVLARRTLAPRTGAPAPSITRPATRRPPTSC